MDCHNLGVDSCFTEDSLLGQFLHSEGESADNIEWIIFAIMYGLF